MSLGTSFIQLEKCNSYAVIRLNRPERKNGLIGEMQDGIRNALKLVEDDDEIKLVVLTGNGEYYSSGADFINAAQGVQARTEENVRKGLTEFRLLVAALIKFPKPIIAAVNGPAIGMAVSTLPLCDVVYAADNSTFLTPFGRLGVTPEACSSYTFPIAMGYTKATEMLLFNRTLNAREACQAGLISDVFPRETFWSEVIKRVDEIVDCPLKSLMYGKQLIREPLKDKLLEINETECEQLVEMYTSDEFLVQTMKFIAKRQKIREARKSKL